MGRRVSIRPNTVQGPDSHCGLVTAISIVMASIDRYELASALNGRTPMCPIILKSIVSERENFDT